MPAAPQDRLLRAQFDRRGNGLMRPISQGRGLCTHFTHTQSLSTTLCLVLAGLWGHREELAGHQQGELSLEGDRCGYSPEPAGHDLQGCGQGFPEEVTPGEGLKMEVDGRWKPGGGTTDRGQLKQRNGGSLVAGL